MTVRNYIYTYHYIYINHYIYNIYIYTYHYISIYISFFSLHLAETDPKVLSQVIPAAESLKAADTTSSCTIQATMQGT